eukprot:1077406-Alexandrium_andersonii.AAC.1
MALGLSDGLKEGGHLVGLLADVHRTLRPKGLPELPSPRSPVLALKVPKLLSLRVDRGHAGQDSVAAVAVAAEVHNLKSFLS